VAFKTQYALGARVESSLSEGSRRFDLRRSRYFGLARTHLQQLLTATAMNVVRVIAWLRGETLGERRRHPGHWESSPPLAVGVTMIRTIGPITTIRMKVIVPTGTVGPVGAIGPIVTVGTDDHNRRRGHIPWFRRRYHATCRTDQERSPYGHHYEGAKFAEPARLR
jgi:hypothetical protein